MTSRISFLSKNLQRITKPSYFVKRFQSAGPVDFKKELVNLPATQVTKLDNALRVASAGDTGAATATVGLWIDAGSRYENESNNGVAHFVEHLAFTGNEKSDLELEIENMGAYLNSSVSREKTVLYAECSSEDVPKVVEILAHVAKNTEFDENQIENARNVILRGMEQAEQNLQNVVFDCLHATAYQGTPLGLSVMGTSLNVGAMKKSDILDYIGEHFKASRIVFAGAGGVSLQELVELAETHLGEVGNTYKGKPPCLLPCRYTGSEIRVRDDSIPLAHIAIAIEGCGLLHKDNMALTLACNLIGAWDHSQVGGAHSASNLVRASAESHLCHKFHSFNICYSDTSLWGVYFVCEPLECENMLYNIQNEWMRLCASVTESEIERAKNLLRTNVLLNLDGPTAICNDIGQQILFNNRRVPLYELMAKIDAITVKRFREVCMTYIYDTCPVVAAVGPVENLPDYNRIRSSMYWLRL